MENLKIKIIDLLKSTKREGIDDLIKYLEENKYFRKPASINHHSNFDGGLAHHSYKVYQNYKDLNEANGRNIPEESIIITAFLHDLCKLDDYIEGPGQMPSEKQLDYLKSLLSRHNKTLSNQLDQLGRSQVSDLIGWLKNNPGQPEPEFEKVWDYNPSKEIPLNHAEKSLIMASRFIKLEMREILAIRYHMGSWDDSLNYKDYNKANQLYPDVKLIAIADELATFQENWVEDQKQ